MQDRVIFSPHCDDVALSLGGAIKNNLLSGKIQVYEIFSISKYSILEQDTGDQEIITKIRKSEEAKVMNLLGASYNFCDYREPILRKEYSSVDDIFDRSLLPHQDSIYGDVKSLVESLMAGEDDKSYFFPLGLGGHIDHRILAEIGKEMHITKPLLRIYFYEDQPYAGQYGLQNIERVAKSIDSVFTSYLFPFDNVLDKMAILKLYKSQFDAEDVGFTFWHTLRRKGEVIWSTKKNIELIEGIK